MPNTSGHCAQLAQRAFSPARSTISRYASEPLIAVKSVKVAARQESAICVLRDAISASEAANSGCVARKTASSAAVSTELTPNPRTHRTQLSGVFGGVNDPISNGSTAMLRRLAAGASNPVTQSRHGRALLNGGSPAGSICSLSVLSLSNTRATPSPLKRVRRRQSDDLSRPAVVAIQSLDITADRSEQRAGRLEVSHFHMRQSCLQAPSGAFARLISTPCHRSVPVLRSST